MSENMVLTACPSFQKLGSYVLSRPREAIRCSRPLPMSRQCLAQETVLSQSPPAFTSLGVKRKANSLSAPNGEKKNDPEGYIFQEKIRSPIASSK